MSRSFKQKIKNKLFLIIGIIGILDSIIIIGLGNPPNVGIIFPSAIGIIFIIEFVLGQFYENSLLKIVNKSKFKNLIKLSVIILIVSFVFVQLLIAYEIRSSDYKEDVDIVIILGGGIKKNNEPSKSLKYRLDLGAKYLKNNKDKSVIVSGGVGFNSENSEAHVMKQCLINIGISEDRIIKEEKSTSTMENFLYSKKLIDDKNKKILIITNDFHMFRAKMLAKRNGFIPFGISADTYKLTFFNSVIREYLAMIKSFIFDR